MRPEEVRVETKEDEKLNTESVNAVQILSSEEIKPKLNPPISERQSTMAETITFITFGVTLTIIAFLIFDVPTNQRIGSAVRTEFNGYSIPFRNIDSKGKYTNWVRELITHTYETMYYSGRPRDQPSKPQIAYANNYISMVRIVQRRMRLVGTGFTDFSNYKPLVWASDGFDYDSPKQDVEDTAPYGPNGIYTYTDKYRLSGYVSYINIFRDSKETSLSILSNYETNNWVDQQTRSIVVDFIVYNPYAKMHTYVSALLLFAKTGSVTPRLDLYHIKDTYYSWQGEEFFRALCEIVFVVILAVYIIQQPFGIYATYKKVKSQFEDQQIIRQRFQNGLVNQERNRYLNCIKIFLEKIKLPVTVIYVHLTDFWNLLDKLCISLSFAFFIYWVKFVVHQRSYSVTVKSFEDPLTNDRFLYAAQLLSTARYLCAFILIIVYVRILKCLGFFAQRVSVLFNTLDRAKYDILHYIILILAVMVGFILFVYIYFGPENELYSTLTNVTTCLFQFMNWWYANFDPLLESDMLIGTILFVAFMITIVFVLMNMFVGFLLRGYREANEELKNRISGRDESGKKIAFRIRVHWLLRIKEIVYAALALVSKRYKDKQRKIEEERACHEANLKQDRNESEEYDKEFNPFSFAQEKRKLPLMSHYIEAQASLERDRKCGSAFYSTLVFLVFVILYVVLLVQQLNVGKGNAMVSSAHDKLVYDVKISLSDGNKDFFGLMDITDLQQLTFWIKKAMPIFVEGSESRYNMLNYIVGDEFRITFRQGKKLPGLTAFDPDFARINSKQDLSHRRLPGENTVPIVGKMQNYFYSEDGGYAGQGGYVTYWAANGTIMRNQSETFVNDAIIGPDTWLFAIEFVAYEPTSSLYLYNAVTIALPSTGQILQDLLCFPLYLPESNSRTGVGIIVLESIFIMFLVYYMVNYVWELNYKWREYSAWIESESTYFTPLQLYQRQQKCPELLRQLKYAFSMYRILDLLFFAFSIIAVVNWVMYCFIIKRLVRVLPYSHVQFDFHSEMFKACNVQQAYINYSSLALIVLSIRMVEYLQYSGSMRVLTTALKKAQEDLLYFLVIFGSLMMGFAGMANIAFGDFSESFRSLGDSWISCFIMIIGEFHISGILNNSLATGTLFLFAFLILFSYILVNVFLVILELNFTSAKEEVGKVDDNIRKLNALLCCCIKKPEEQKLVVENTEKSVASLPGSISMLAELGLSVETVHNSLKWWADGVARQIRTEIKYRRLLNEQLKEKLQEISLRKARDENDPNSMRALMERKNYLHYLRVACQLFEYQCKAIEGKITSLEKQIKDKAEKYHEERKDYYRAKKIGKLVEKELAAKLQAIESNPGGLIRRKKKTGNMPPIIEADDKQEEEEDEVKGNINIKDKPQHFYEMYQKITRAKP
eukprot:TRINITY_DN418_c0_g1_i1.p1 TRINITY_DN418_c0_g1~~TRINITY_DN418_c0_g1_i1.p1  ORF type:complete len:1397 (+),score=125.69 TRINITY_DN418_c0_g1_i1:158-4348(+)